MDEAERCSRVGFLYRSELLLVENPVAIKKDYPYNIFEIAGADFRTLAQAAPIRGLQIIDSYPVANVIHLVLAKTTETELKRTLKQYEPDLKIRLIEPNFEDVFISVIRGKRL